MTKSSTPKVAAKKAHKKARGARRKNATKVAVEKARDTHRKTSPKVAIGEARDTHREIAAQFEAFAIAKSQPQCRSLLRAA